MIPYLHCSKPALDFYTCAGQRAKRARVNSAVSFASRGVSSLPKQMVVTRGYPGDHVTVIHGNR